MSLDLRSDGRHKRAFLSRAAESGLARTAPGLRFTEHMDEADGPLVFAHACKLGLEGIVSKRKDSRYRSGRSPDWIKSKNPDAPAGRPKKTGAVETSTGYFLPQRAAGPIKAGRWTERSSCRWGSVSSRALASLPLGQSAIHGLSQSSQQRPRGRFLWLSIGQCRPIEIAHRRPP